MRSRPDRPWKASKALLFGTAVLFYILAGCSDDTPRPVDRNIPVDLGELPRGDTQERVIQITHPDAGMELEVSEITSCCGGIEVLDYPDLIRPDQEQWPLKIRLLGDLPPQQLKRVIAVTYTNGHSEATEVEFTITDSGPVFSTDIVNIGAMPDGTTYDRNVFILNSSSRLGSKAWRLVRAYSTDAQRVAPRLVTNSEGNEFVRLRIKSMGPDEERKIRVNVVYEQAGVMHEKGFDVLLHGVSPLGIRDRELFLGHLSPYGDRVVEIFRDNEADDVGTWVLDCPEESDITVRLLGVEKEVVKLLIRPRYGVSGIVSTEVLIRNTSTGASDNVVLSGFVQQHPPG